jgi:hypothetical protein
METNWLSFLNPFHEASPIGRRSTSMTRIYWVETKVETKGLEPSTPAVQMRRVATALASIVCSVPVWGDSDGPSVGKYQ